MYLNAFVLLLVAAVSLFGSAPSSGLFTIAGAAAQGSRLGQAGGAWPVWLPDGQLLALVPATGGHPGSLLVTLDAAGGPARPQGPLPLPTAPAGLRWDAAHARAVAVLPGEGGPDYRLLSFAPDEKIAQILTLRDYEQAPYLVLATKKGLVKKTLLADYDSARSSGLIAVNFREDGDELIGAALVSDRDDLLLVSRKAQAIRFRADNDQLRPMGRATSGVTGMKFRGDDELLSMAVVPAEDEAAVVAEAVDGEVEETPIDTETIAATVPGADLFVFTITDGGYAKRTRVTEYRL